MSDKLISFVFPVYNDVPHLDRSIGAVLNQTYRNIEVILTDDGSTDGSGELCESYAAKDSRVRVFHKPNGGHSSAVNYGLERSKGDYILICDTDDWYEPDACESALKAAEEHPEADVVIFAIYRPDKEPVDDPAAQVTFDKKKIDCMLLSGDTADFCRIGFHVESTWAKLIRADVIREHCVRMPEQLFLAEDAVFCLNLFEHCRSVVFDSRHIYHYEIRFDSFCRKYSDIAVKMLPEILKEQERYISAYHPDDAEYAEANDRSVFAWINETEDHYFFNEQQTRPAKQIYAEYTEFLKNPEVKRHVDRIRLTDSDSLMRKLRLGLYRHPVYPGFLLYRKMKTGRKTT